MMYMIMRLSVLMMLVLFRRVAVEHEFLSEVAEIHYLNLLVLLLVLLRFLFAAFFAFLGDRFFLLQFPEEGQLFSLRSFLLRLAFVFFADFFFLFEFKLFLFRGLGRCEFIIVIVEGPLVLVYICVIKQDGLILENILLFKLFGRSFLLKVDYFCLFFNNYLLFDFCLFGDNLFLFFKVRLIESPLVVLF